MAKLGSFFRRLFSPDDSDPPSSSSSPPVPESRKSGTSIIPPASSSTTEMKTKDARSCATPPRVVVKQTTLNVDRMNEIPKSNYLSSDINKANIRRLSAPLLIQTIAHPHSQYPSTIFNESTEEALLSSLQRSAFSSAATTPVATHPDHSIHSLAASSGEGGVGSSSASLLSRPDIRSASFNLPALPSSISNSQVNNIPLAGR